MSLRALWAVLVLAALLVPACTPTQKGAGIGAVTGAAAGALIDHHHRTRGAAIGAVAGGLVGGVVGHTYEITKFCPACGRRYHQSKHVCPYDGTQLQYRR